MIQICLVCGAEYTEPTGRCTALVKTERLLEGEVVWVNAPCAAMQWCYPAPEPEPVAVPAAVDTEQPSSKHDNHKDNRGHNRK